MAMDARTIRHYSATTTPVSYTHLFNRGAATDSFATAFFAMRKVCAGKLAASISAFIEFGENKNVKRERSHFESREM